MLEWFSKKQRDEKRRQEQETAIKQSLAEKVKRFQAPAIKKVAAYTELTLNGKRLRVAKEHITIQAISPITAEHPTGL